MEEQWLTYQQASELLGVSAEAVRRHVRRHGWRTQRGNNGKALVLVPPTAAGEGWARPGGQQGGHPGGQDDGRTPGQTGHLPGHEELVAELRRRAEAAEQAVQDAIRRAEAAEIRAQELGDELAEQRGLTGRAEGQAVVLWEALAQERGRTERAEADAKARQEAIARETMRVEQAEVARQIAEVQRDAAQSARDAAQKELAEWTTGGSLIRAWRAFLNRRGRL
jgi:hypothetical protein